MRAYELVEQEQQTPSPKIYLDMDGVLADFFAGYQKVNPNVNREQGIPAAKEDPTLQQIVGTDFYFQLPKYNSADKLVQMVLSYADHYNICSSPLRGDFANSEQQKRKWIQKYLSPQPKDIIITAQKEKHAQQADGTPNILIDDKPSNIVRWINKGGIGIHYDADSDSLDVVAKGLEQAYGY